MHDLLNDGTLSKPRLFQLQTFPEPILQKKIQHVPREKLMTTIKSRTWDTNSTIVFDWKD